MTLPPSELSNLSTRKDSVPAHPFPVRASHRPWSLTFPLVTLSPSDPSEAIYCQVHILCFIKLNRQPGINRKRLYRCRGQWKQEQPGWTSPREETNKPLPLGSPLPPGQSKGCQKSSCHQGMPPTLHYWTPNRRCRCSVNICWMDSIFWGEKKKFTLIESFISTKLFCSILFHLHYLISYSNNAKWYYVCLKNKKYENSGAQKVDVIYPSPCH